MFLIYTMWTTPAAVDPFLFTSGGALKERVLLGTASYGNLS